VTAEPDERMRIATLIASATEIVAALGCGDRLVARSHECDYPPWVSRLPAVTAPKFDVAGTSGEIDRRVREIVAEGLSVYRIDAELLQSLAPDLIVTQDQCEVCAVSLADVQAAICTWIGGATRIVSLRPDSLEDVFREIGRVASALGVPNRGDELVRKMRRRLNDISQSTRALSHPRVAFIGWADPLMSGGNWMPSLIEAAGGIDIFGGAAGKSKVLSWSDLLAADPDVILIAPCGYDLAASQRDEAALARDSRWSQLAAVRAGRVYCADGNAYFNRPGPRLAETAEIIAECLHPQHFAFGHEGRGWMRALDAEHRAAFTR
jgi:iron complex transport system substrate-binding protein